MIRLLDTSFPDQPGLDTAISRAILLRGSDGDLGETLRLHVPGRVVAFGRQDVVSPGYPAALRATYGSGFAPIERLAGGRAAVFHEGTLAFAWMIPEPDPKTTITARFERVAGLIRNVLEDLGLDARVGEVPGEYCPGSYSVNIGGRSKVMGIGQRLAKHAAHVGGVIVVHAAELVNTPLIPVYEALGLSWDPATTGAIEDSLEDTNVSAVREAFTARVMAEADLAPMTLEPATLALARSLTPQHVPVGDAPAPR